MDLVRAVAYRYRDLGVPVEDLVQEGVIGLLEACDRFDPEKGAFSTYAFWRIRESVTHALTAQSHLVRLPKHIVERRRAIAGATARLVNSGQTPLAADIGAQIGLSAAAVEEALAAPTTVVSLDEPTPDGAPLEAMVADATAVDPAEEVLAAAGRDVVMKAVSHLSPRKRLVITHHFGLDTNPQTLSRVAAELELSPQRTHAIEQEALDELAADLAEA